MNIYIELTNLFPSASSFRGSYVLDQVKALQKVSKYNIITIKVVDYFSKEKDYVIDGVEVWIFKILSIPSGIIPDAFLSINTKRLYDFLSKRVDDLRKIEFVHGHVLFNSGALAVRLCCKYLNSARSIVQHHGFDIFGTSNGILANNKAHKYYLINSGVKICNNADINLCVSNKVLEILKSSNKIDIKKSIVLYNGVDIDKFMQLDGLKSTRLYTIGCVANFWSLKDQITLIKAIHKLVNEWICDIRLILIGSGYTLDKCVDYVSKEGLSEYIFFEKEIVNDELVKFYNKLNFFVLPSYYEAFGCVYVEAYACGVPFIGVKGQGIEEIINPAQHDLFLINKGDSSSLAELIKFHKRESPIMNLSLSLDIKCLINEYLNKINN